MTGTTLAPERYFELIDSDTQRLAEMGERGLGASVPSCPDWDVADVVRHTAQVYEHKVRVMADNGWPDPWPPSGFGEREPVEFLRDALANLFAEFALHELAEQTTTFGADTTIAFWLRRMALEVAVHRYDGELAHAATTAIPADEALDGIDEILRITLAGPWWSDYDTEHPVDARVAVEAGGLRWLCALDARSVTITDDTSTPAQATVSGPADAVFLWLWGRVDETAIESSGDPLVLREFRERLVECSG